MKIYPIPQPLMQQIIGLLAERPWKEVNPVMAQLFPVVNAINNAGDPVHDETPKTNGNAEAQQ